MVFQLPKAVYADAAGALFYSFVCLISNILLVWLTWTHRERTSYIACIAYFALIATLSSVIQQFYDYVLWKDILTEQFNDLRDHADSAEVQYHRGATGLKLVLSYIRIFAFNIESTFVFFFALSLAITVYGWWSQNSKPQRIFSITGRVVPLALTAITIVLLEFPFAQRSYTTYMIIANAQFIISLIGSSIFLVMILAKYMESRRQFRTWNVSRELEKSSATTSFSSGRYSRKLSIPGTGGTYDSWLVIRLTVALLMLCTFEILAILPRVATQRKLAQNIADNVLDLSDKRALSSIRGYISGVTPSIVAFIVFGTTRPFREKLLATFVPKRWRKNTNETWPQNRGAPTYTTRSSRPRTMSRPATLASRSGGDIVLKDIRHFGGSALDDDRMSILNPANGSGVRTRIWSP
ncbi:uncharacterized protein BCR38DRAFT_399315 [Pseudomassariella vexata]|uniref:Glycoside hydrolase n=1 Tax=Pseudomassariella vexata TaxID=1141098 RepID=A0A1Y2DIX2_9PEZI|nr:uncharacterized protein BCR38DRAFT_399315 [Pseudomassariella vexata]ORY59126.1 hypothetical protein BCR38DRAFT_399315 [Pseudomassariella vexata]